MRATITKVIPSTEELVPCLHVHLEIQHTRTNCCHLEVQGLMLSSDNKFLSDGKEIGDSEYKLTSSDFPLISNCNVKVSEVQPNADLVHFTTILKFPIDPKVFGYIEDSRHTNENRDVYLNFLVKTRFIEHNFNLNDRTLTIRDNNETLGKKNLFNMREFREKVNNYKISSSDWVSKYKEPLGFGKFILFEIDQPSFNNIPSFNSTYIDVPRLRERLEAAIASLYAMENYIKKGEWNQVAEQLRDIQLLKSDMKKDIKILLRTTTNLPDDKCEQFTTTLDNLYGFSSQFHHPLDHGKVSPIMNVNKEDAYFAYMLMLAITQLLIKKIENLRNLQ